MSRLSRTYSLISRIIRLNTTKSESVKDFSWTSVKWEVRKFPSKDVVVVVVVPSVPRQIRFVRRHSSDKNKQTNRKNALLYHNQRVKEVQKHNPTKEHAATSQNEDKSTMGSEQKITIRVAGLGHKFILKDLDADSTTVADLRIKVYKETGLPPRFQKFLGPQRLNITYKEENDLADTTLAELKIQDRTRLMLLHSPNYQTEKDIYQQLLRVDQEISKLETSIRNHTKETQNTKYVPEMVTRICCKLDAIDVAGSKDLRAHRKELIRKAEQLESYAADTSAEC